MTNLADGVAVVAWAWLASLLTRDPLLIALVPIALKLPWFAFAIPAGIVTDRMDRRRLIIAMDILRAAGFVTATIAIWAALPLADAPARGLAAPGLFALIMGAALSVGIAEVFRDNASQTILPALTPHAQLERANGRLWSVELVGNALLGPALGAFLIAAFLPAPFALNAACYAVAIWLVWRLTGNFKPEVTQSRDWRRELKEGYDFLIAAPFLRVLALITGVWNLLFEMITVPLVLHVQDNLGLDARAYGLILAAGAIGGIAGGLMAERVIALLGPKRTAQIMLAASAPAFFAFAYAPGPVSLGVFMAVFQFTGLVWNTVSVSYRQRMIPDALLGRVNSLYRLLAWGMMPVGLLASGLIMRGASAALPHQNAVLVPILVAAIGATILAIIGWRALERWFPASNPPAT